MERTKGIKLLQRVFGNILNDPKNPKFRDINFSKIRKKLDQCRPAFALLIMAGFAQSADKERLQWEYDDMNMQQLQSVSNALDSKIKEHGGIAFLNWFDLRVHAQCLASL